MKFFKALRDNIILKTSLSKKDAELKYMMLKLEDKPDFKSTIDRILQERVKLTFLFMLIKLKPNSNQTLNLAVLVRFVQD